MNRHILFDEAFQEKLEEMCRQTGAGDPPHPPAMLCMVLLLQGHVGASDAEAVEMAVMDLRWQMVLGCLGTLPEIWTFQAILACSVTPANRPEEEGALLLVEDVHEDSACRFEPASKSTRRRQSCSWEAHPYPNNSISQNGPSR